MGVFLLLRLAAFLVVPFVYWLAGLLNHSQAGKAALLGGLAVLAVSAWRVARTPQRDAAGLAWDIAIAAPFFFILALEAFLRDFFGVSHDDAIVTEALFNTTGGEAGEFLLANSRGLLKHVGLFTAGLTFFGAVSWVSNRYRRRRLPAAPALASLPWHRRRGARLALVFGGLFLLIHLNPTMRKADPFLYFPLRYAKWQHDIDKTRDLQERLLATQDDPHLRSMQYTGAGQRTVVFILGESTTRLDWSLYGYPRQTTPELQAVAADLLVFKDVITGYPGTDGSIKRIFTPASIRQPDLWMTQPDLLTMVKRAGYKTFWLSNHGTDRYGAASIIASHADVAEFTNKGGSRGEGSYDEVLLPAFRQALADPAPRKFIVLHMLGAHPAYQFRYPEAFAKFDGKFDEVTKQLLGAGRAFWAVMLRNQYDNAIAYMDHMLRQMLDMTRAQATGTPVAWLFVPDHGEDVAHYNNFVGHNSHVRSMYEVPMIFWSSAGFDTAPVDRDALLSRPYQLDVLDATLLGLLAIRGDYYEAENDIFSPAFRPAQRVVDGKPYP
jgi:heptose-I-phosphate ethanolaminephosphotransferase